MMNRAMGFCLFNNVAVAAVTAIDELEVDRVLIVDWDVHHGNGTQAAFVERDDVLVFNSHQSPLFPGTGALAETGSNAGAGFTVNVPLPEGVGDAAVVAIYRELLPDIARAFDPDLVLVSAGFDAHKADSMADLRMTEAGFAQLCAIVCEIADRHPGERVVVVAHGGALSMALGQILDGDYTRWRRVMGNCAVTELVLEPEPALLSFNVTDHLEDT